MAEDKRNKFLRLGEKRMNQTLHNMDKVKKLSNKINYNYTEEDVKKIEKALQEKTKEVVDSFYEGLKKGDKQKAENQFTFGGKNENGKNRELGPNKSKGMKW